MKEIAFGILLPWLGTSLGAACVFFMRGKMHRGLQRGLTGFAAGVMVAASIWSLLIPAMEQSEHMGVWAFVPAAVGFWLGILFLLLLDRLIPHLHANSKKAEGPKSSLSRSTMMVLAVTLHNLPEGMAVGVVFAGWTMGNAELSLAGALTLSLGIAIQNFPEGAIISMPLRSEGTSKGRAFSTIGCKISVLNLRPNIFNSVSTLSYLISLMLSIEPATLSNSSPTLVRDLTTARFASSPIVPNASAAMVRASCSLVHSRMSLTIESMTFFIVFLPAFHSLKVF